MKKHINNPQPKLRVLKRANFGEVSRVANLLRQETVGGFLLVVASAIAIIWANSPARDSYFALRDAHLGTPPFNLSLGVWASDGLLAIFFFLVGLELKREILIGSLNKIRTAIVPVLAAVGGVAVPALIYTAVNFSNPESLRGWAIPTATDIAFAVAVLAVIGSHLPPALRMFLLTLAVVDDLIAISIIAIFFTTGLRLEWLLWAIIPIIAYAFISHRFRTFFETYLAAAWLILLPLGAIVWVMIFISGIHATIAGVLLGFMIPVKSSRSQDLSQNPRGGLAEQFEFRFRPISVAIAVPVFAFFSAGVTVGGLDGLGVALTNPVGFGIVTALVLGKPIGILTTTWLATRSGRTSLDPTVKGIDLLGVGLLGGIGYTVSLLVTEINFGVSGIYSDSAKVAILFSSLTASALASAVLVARNRKYKSFEKKSRNCK